MKLGINAGVVLLGSLLTFQLMAQSDTIEKSFSLEEAQKFAVDNYYQSKNASLDIKSAKWKVWETTAIGLPQVSVSASYQHIPGDIPAIDFGSELAVIFEPLAEAGILDPNAIPAGEPSAIAVRNSLTYTATVSQLIFSGEYIVGLQASKAYQGMSAEASERTNLEIKASVAEGYYSLLILKDNREAVVKTLKNLQDNLVRMQKMYKQGFIEDTEVDQIDLVVKTTGNELASMDRQIEFLENMFKYQIGLEPQTKVTLTEAIDDLIARNLVNDSNYVFNLDKNIDYRMLSTQERLMELSMRREQSKYLPSVAGFYQYQDKTEKADFDFTINHIVGVSVEVPIVTSGSRIAKVSQARIEYEKALNQKEQEANRLVTAARQASYDYHTAVEKYTNALDNLHLSARVYEKTNLKHQQGVVSSLELTLINNQYLQAQMGYSMAVQELLTAKTKLDKAFNLL